MTQGNSQAPATKQDIGMIMEEFGKLYDANERWKNEILDQMDQKFDVRFAASEEKLTRHFMVIAENMRHDFIGAHNDKIQNHENRITRLEFHTKIPV